MSSSFQRLLLPLGPDIDQDRVLPPATVLASWFDASIQIVCATEDEVVRYQTLAAGLGVPVEPVVQLDDLSTEGLAAMASAHEQTLIIAEASAFGLEVAASSTRPVFLVADRPDLRRAAPGANAPRRSGHRLPLGPLAVEITGADDDLDALALAAVMAPVLEESIRLVVPTSGCDGDSLDSSLAEPAAAAEHRLAAMGCEVGIDALRSHGLEPLVLIGRTRSCTAMVIPQRRLDEPKLVDRAIATGVNVLVAPAPRPGVGRPAPFAVDLSRPVDHSPAGADLAELPRSECMARLDRHTLARIGYVDAGWPTVIPVNYRVDRGDIFIRSLGGGKLRAAERGDMVCLELDGYDERLRTGWSVVVHGRLEVIDDAATLRKAWDDDPHPWVAADRWHWLRLLPFSVSGRTVEPGVTGGSGAPVDQSQERV